MQSTAYYRVLAFTLLACIACAGCVSHISASDASNPQLAPTPAPVVVQNINIAPAAASKAHRVTRVVDGDTVVVSIEGKETKVRLIGVDTPETVHPQKPVEAYGKEASSFLKNLLEGESVHLEYESGPSRLDKHGRTLAYLYRSPDRLFINLEIIRQGYGHAYTKYPFQHMELFRSSERVAREAGKGLWGQGATIISDVEPAAPSAPERAATARPATVELKETTVYVTRTGEKYHRDGCRYLSRSRIPVSLKDAKLGYSACSVCRPPQ